MSTSDILKQATNYFKMAYPGLTAESIVCFLIFIDMEDGSTVGELGRTIGMTEPDTYHHLTMLTHGKGAGLIRLENTGDGSSHIWLTDTGGSVKETVRQLFEGV